MQAATVDDMNAGKKILLVLSLAAITALVMFAVLRVMALTSRVRTLENVLYSRQQTPPPQATDSAQLKAAPPDGSEQKVLNVIDGDTITIETADGSLPVRIIGIDTPETVHPFKPIESGGEEASGKAKELLEGQTVTIHYDPDPKHGKWDKYQRLLAYLALPDGRDFGLVMIQEGFAKAYPNYPFSRQELYLETEEIARQNKVGVWAVQKDPNKPVLP